MSNLEDPIFDDDTDELYTVKQGFFARLRDMPMTRDVAAWLAVAVVSVVLAGIIALKLISSHHSTPPPSLPAAPVPTFSPASPLPAPSSPAVTHRIMTPPPPPPPPVKLKHHHAVVHNPPPPPPPPVPDHAPPPPPSPSPSVSPSPSPSSS